MKKFLIGFFCIIMLCIFVSTPKETKTVIKFSSWGSQSEISFLLPLIKEFEKNNPDIKIEFLHIPQSYFQKLHLLFASNLAPDVIFVNNHYLPKYVEANLLENLSDLVQQDVYFDKSLKCLSVNNKLYAIPRDISGLVVYYNKDLFDKYKIPYPQPNWTLSDYLKISKQFKTHGVWGISYQTEPIFWLPYLMSNGGGIFDNNGKYIIESQESINSVKFYTDLANKYNVAPKLSESAGVTMAQLFIQQKIAMHLSGRWLVPKYRNDAKFDWDVINFPHGSIGSVVPIDASGYAISKSSKHKQEAYKFLRFISSQYALEQLTQSGLIVPARKDVAYSSLFLDSKKPQNANVYLDIIKTGKITPVNNKYQQILDNINKKLEPLFLGTN